MKSAFIALAVSASFLTATPAAAQDKVLNPTRDTPESMQAYGKILKYADCLIGSGQSAVSILKAEPYSRGERNKTGLLRDRVPTCSKADVQNVHSLMRGALAEATYLRDVRQAPALDPSRSAAFLAQETAFQSQRDKGDQTMAAVMSCMVAASPDKAHAVLASQHGSAAEATAMDVFFAASQKCGAGATRPANLSRSFVRAFVADSAWRLAHIAAR